MEQPVWEPPLDGDEAQHVFGALDRLRYTFRWKADGLDADALAFRLPSSALSLGGLLKHLAACEAFKSAWDLDGMPPDAPFDQPGHAHQWALDSAADDSPAALYALYDGCVVRARERCAAAYGAAGLGRETAMGSRWGARVSMRRLMMDLVEEYGRHTGHADVLREAIDGRTGEDPPQDWPGPPAWQAWPLTMR